MLCPIPCSPAGWYRGFAPGLFVGASGAGGDPRRFRITDLTLRDDLATGVVTADPRVDVDELVHGDDAVIQRRQAVLDADVVPRRPGEPGLGVNTEGVDHVVLVGAADAGRLEGRILVHRVEHDLVTVVRPRLG